MYHEARKNLKPMMAEDRAEKAVATSPASESTKNTADLDHGVSKPIIGQDKLDEEDGFNREQRGQCAPPPHKNLLEVSAQYMTFWLIYGNIKAK